MKFTGQTTGASVCTTINTLKDTTTKFSFTVAVSGTSATAAGIEATLGDTNPIVFTCADLSASTTSSKCEFKSGTPAAQEYTIKTVATTTGETTITAAASPQVKIIANAGYITLDSAKNTAVTVDFKDGALSALINFSSDLSTVPKFKVGTTEITCEYNATTDKKVVKCPVAIANFPVDTTDATKAKAYIIKYVNQCSLEEDAITVNVKKTGSSSSSSFLQLSLSIISILSLLF